MGKRSSANHSVIIVVVLVVFVCFPLVFVTARSYRLRSLPDTSTLCNVPQIQADLWLDRRDMGFTPHLCRGEGWEAVVTTVIDCASKISGGRMVDVGANFGYYTMLMARNVGPLGRVLAVEASPRVYSHLAQSVAHNLYSDRVSAVNFAAHSVAGRTLSFVDRPERSLNGELSNDPDLLQSQLRDTAPAATVHVPSMTVDQLTADWISVDFVKIDVEGAEIDAYLGMRQLLSRSPTARLLIEVNADRSRRQGRTDHEILAFYLLLEHDWGQLFAIATHGTPANEPLLKPITPRVLLEPSKGQDTVLVLGRDPHPKALGFPPTWPGKCL